MSPTLLTPLHSQTKIFTLIPNSPFSISPPLHSSFSTQSLTFPRKPISSYPLSVSLNSFYPSIQTQPQEEDDDEEEEEEEHVIGDCVVFEEGVFEDPYLQDDFVYKKPIKKKYTQEENLVPDEWIEAQMEINITKKEKRKIAQQIEYGSRLEKKNTKIPSVKTEEYLTYKEYKMSKLQPVILDNPEFPLEEEEEMGVDKNVSEVESSSSSSRVVPRNPRVAVYKGTLDDITEFFNSDDYVPGENGGKKSQGKRKLLSKEEKVLLNKRIPNLENASSGKWLPLHTLAASGEFYLVNALLKHTADINAADKDGLTALHKAIMCRKQAVTNYLLRESANPFIRDKEGATLMHYAVQAAAIPTIKILLLYNVDINLADDDGWTPLHLAIQTRRTDVVKLLLIKGADKTLRNQDGLTPLDLCLYSGRATRTCELIMLLKQLPKSRRLPEKQQT
ncbi:Ankyrin repeat domain-containing protein [Thalictrum thalictroides]|uniref:Ankyrin repeat domain-containing protein n=1 Tax=Thalictrum thalictroides TaxID=46969 RepID=A0A7J6VH02_THATH|nr:Ankyrin repeat domain-containing protein [Thalictrum thalictroides]